MFASRLLVRVLSLLGIQQLLVLAVRLKELGWIVSTGAISDCCYPILLMVFKKRYLNTLSG